MIFTDHVDNSKVYFGQRNRQMLQRILVDDLLKKPGVYILRGGSRAGKSTLIGKTLDIMKNDGAISEVLESDAFLKRFSDIANITAPWLHKDKYKLYENKTSSFPKYILSISPEVFFPDVKIMNSRKRIEDVFSIQERLEDEIAIILESPIVNIPAFPGMGSKYHGEDFAAENNAFKELIDAHPALKVYALEYEPKQIKEVLWENRNKDIPYFLAYSRIDGQTPEWEKIIAVLKKAENITPDQGTKYKRARREYDKAFQAILALQGIEPSGPFFTIAYLERDKK